MIAASRGEHLQFKLSRDLDGGSDDFSLPMGSIDFGDISSETGSLGLFDITPREPRSGGVRLAGEPPRGVGDNGGPPLGSRQKFRELVHRKALP